MIMLLCKYRLIERLEHWLEALPIVSGTSSVLRREASPEELSSNEGPYHQPSCDSIESQQRLPDFPLVPVSKGFKLTLRKELDQFKSALSSLGR